MANCNVLDLLVWCTFEKMSKEKSAKVDLKSTEGHGQVTDDGSTKVIHDAEYPEVSPNKFCIDY